MWTHCSSAFENYQQKQNNIEIVNAAMLEEVLTYNVDHNCRWHNASTHQPIGYG